MGPQGSGKGTQAELMARELGIPTFGMGQLIRDEIATGSELGKKLYDIILPGNLVSDVDAANLLKLRLVKPDTARGYILDGYPRNIAQYNQFTFDIPTHAIVIDIPREESLKRLGGRLTCRVCNKVGAMKDGLKIGERCAACGGEWYQRADDTPDAIARRLEIYKNDTQAVIEKYSQIVLRVDGVGTIEEVWDRIKKVLKIGKYGAC
jgi:adenylate kinase